VQSNDCEDVFNLATPEALGGSVLLKKATDKFPEQKKLWKFQASPEEQQQMQELQYVVDDMFERERYYANKEFMNLVQSDGWLPLKLVTRHYSVSPFAIAMNLEPDSIEFYEFMMKALYFSNLVETKKETFIAGNKYYVRFGLLS